MNKILVTVVFVFTTVLSAESIAGDVKVYGAVQFELSDVTPDKGDSGKAAGDNGRGRIGVTATEDLSQGLLGLAKFEFKADTADNDTGNLGSNSSGSNAALSGREAYVGIKGGFGTIVAGRLKSPYKYAGGYNYDAFVTTQLEARGNAGMSGEFATDIDAAEDLDPDNASIDISLPYLGHNDFVPKVMGYMTPATNRVILQMLIAPTNNEGQIVGALKYKEKDYEVFVGFVDSGDIGKDTNLSSAAQTTMSATAADQRSTVNVEYTAAKIGGSYRAGLHRFMFQYEATESTVVGGGQFGTSGVTYDLKEEHNLWFLAYRFKYGNNTLVLQTGNDEQTNYVGGISSPAVNQSYSAAGVIYNFSRDTRLIFGWRDTEDVEKVLTLGLRKDFN